MAENTARRNPQKAFTVSGHETRIERAASIPADICIPVLGLPPPTHA